MIANEHAELDKAKESVYILQRDSCTNIKSVGKPVIHNAREQPAGAWMKDPLGIMGTVTVFTMEGQTGRNVVEEFENMDKFKAGVTCKTYILPYNWDGTGAMVYGPYVYYNRENSPYIDKYSLRTERVEATISFSGFTARKNSYAWDNKINSGMDLGVDEQGLWVLWGSIGNNGKMYASKIDVYKNVITHTWTLNTETMTSIANAFVVCGVIYCIDASSAKTTIINFAYNTKTGKQWNPNMQYERVSGVSYMVNYNPEEKVLYAWDYRRQVTHSLTFGTSSK